MTLWGVAAQLISKGAGTLFGRVAGAPIVPTYSSYLAQRAIQPSLFQMLQSQFKTAVAMTAVPATAIIAGSAIAGNKPPSRELIGATVAGAGAGALGAVTVLAPSVLKQLQANVPSYVAPAAAGLGAGIAIGAVGAQQISKVQNATLPQPQAISTKRKKTRYARRAKRARASGKSRSAKRRRQSKSK